MDGIVLINKPVGITSYDVIRKAKSVFKTSKIGHTGTLDPFASGLLILCIGKATKLVDLLSEGSKSYVATIVFNHHYDTYDTTGTILESDNRLIDKTTFVETLEAFKGRNLQMPPMYSAIKVQGKKLYEYARKGIEVSVDERPIEIFDINYLSEIANNEFMFDVTVSKGTYIRSLAVDIAKKLGTFGALKSLIRTKNSDYTINDAVNLEDLTVNDLIPLESLYNDSPSVILNDYMIKLVKNGIVLDERQIITDDIFKVYDSNSKLIAIYKPVSEKKYKPVIII